MSLRLSLTSIAAALLLVCALTGPSVARAEGEWAIAIDEAEPQGAPCVTATEIASEVNARTGALLVVLTGTPVERAAATAEHLIEGRLSHLDGRVALALELRDAERALVGERLLDRPEAECAALRDAAVLAVAVMIGKGEALLTPPPSAQPETAQPVIAEPVVAEPVVATPEPPTPEPPAEPVSQPEPKRPAAQRADPDGPPLHLQVFAGALGTAGVVPGLAAHASITARLTNAVPWPLELSAAFLGQAQAELGGESAGRVEFAPFYAVLTACPLGLGAHKLHADACLGVLGGVAFASATGFTLNNESSAQPLVGLVLRLPLSLQLWDGLFARASAMVGTPLIYSRVRAIDADLNRRELAQSPPVFASVELALGMELF